MLNSSVKIKEHLGVAVNIGRRTDKLPLSHPMPELHFEHDPGPKRGLIYDVSATCSVESYQSGKICVANRPSVKS